MKKFENARRRLENLINRTVNYQRLFLDDQKNYKLESLEFFSWLHKFCHVDRPSYKMNPNTGQIDPYATHVAEGRREVYCEIIRLMKIDERKLMIQMSTLKKEDYDE